VRRTAWYFDSLNAYLLKGQAADGLGLTTDSLMNSPQLMNRSANMACWPKVWRWPAIAGAVTFTRGPQATFHDGSVVTAEDVGAFTSKT
jgi:microcin C transport system substrate-binding protein